MGRVAQATTVKYAKAVLPFCKYVSENDLFHGLESLEGAVGMFLPQVRDQDLRMLSGGLRHYFPFIGKTRISADLKGLEKTNERRPRVPASERLSRAFTHYLWGELSFAEATGAQVMFDAKLRTCEALKVRACDVIFASSAVRNTTIRLGKTKNGREQAAVLDAGCLGEKMLRILVRCSRDRNAPLFCFGNYARVHKYCCKFKAHYGLAIEFTPHSLRAGSATNDKLKGVSLADIQYRGRWESMATARGYIDVVYAILPETLAEEAKVPFFDDAEFV